MFISFNPLSAFIWIFLSSLLPGAILGLGLFRKTELKWIEKVLSGSAIGFAAVGFIAFLFHMGNILFSYSVALLSIFLFYAIAILVFIKSKAYQEEGMRSLVPNLYPLDSSASLNNIKIFFISHAPSLVLLVILLLTFWIRWQAYSPIFQELDPYFYAYAPQQLITLGTTPFNDKTAWYPELEINHRTTPLLSFIEATWYTLYTSGGQYNNYYLVLVSNFYPPLAAMFMIFFMYMLTASTSKREYGVIFAAVASFVPVSIIKFAAGEIEIQAFAFFALLFFFAAYAWAVAKNSRLFALVAGIAYIYLTLGSSSSQVAAIALTIFIPLQSMLLFVTKSKKEIFDFGVLNLIVVLLGPVIGTAVLSGIHAAGSLYLSSFIFPFVLLIPFIFALSIIKNKITDREMSFYIVIGILVAGVLLYFLTPVNSLVKNIGSDALRVAQFTTALQRTIAEQGTAGTVFQDQLGFVAATPSEIGGSDNNPLTKIFQIFFAPLSFIANEFLRFLIAFLNNTLGTRLEYGTKADSLLMVFVFLFLLSVAYALYRALRYSESSIAFLFLTFTIPPMIVGILKAKFVIYMGIMLVASLGFVWFEMERLISAILRRITKSHNYGKHIFIFMLVAGSLLAVGQFLNDELAPAVLFNSLSPRFQDNPLAVKDKLKTICQTIRLQGGDEPDVCSAADDPLAYASKGTNYQYNTKLCLISVFSNIASQTAKDQLAASYRCQRLSEYWIDSMEWIAAKTEPNARITSWWDYGHWTNFFGQRNTVLRNDHASLSMIGEVAHSYLEGSSEELKTFMNSHDSKYALFDAELLIGGKSLGGKYGALNYLSCARNNQTDVSTPTGTSICEAEHLWETIYVPPINSPDPNHKCVLSSSANKTGIIAYRLMIEKDPQGLISRTVPAYCIGETTLASGEKIATTHYLDKKHPNGDLKLNKAIPKLDGKTGEGVSVYTLFYTEEPIWLENGEIKSGYEDRKGKFYDSNLYRAWFLENLPGFKLVYKTGGGQVKIFKIIE